MQWSKTYGGANDDAGSSLVQTSGLGYAIAGATRSFGAGLSDVYLVKADSLGNGQWSKTYGGPDPDFGNSLVRTIDGGYATVGYTHILTPMAMMMWCF
jgi:hypothetical protein